MRTTAHAFPASGSSACHSVSLRSTTWVQVFVDTHPWPAYPGESLVELIPGICLALALAVEPFVQNARGAIDIGVTPLRVVRDSVVVQVSLDACLGTFEHFAFT